MLHAADVAVVLDSGSLERAREAGARFCVAVAPGLDLGFGPELADADRVVVAHEQLVPLAARLGVPRDRVDVGGPVAPRGYAPAADRAALRRELGVPETLPIVLVSSGTFDVHGAEMLFVQLGLVRDGVGFVFDVGDDAEAAETVRRLVPIHGIEAWMFAEDASEVRHHQLADIALVRARGPEVARALAVGAPLVVLPPGRSDRAIVETLEASGAADAADAVATLAVALDGALDAGALARAREAVEALGMAEGASRVAARVNEAWREWRSRASDAPRRGLPRGFERVSREAPSRASAPAIASSETEALEARIDRELAALKQKMREEG